MSKLTIPYGRQEINADDIAAVVDVLRSEWLTQGPAVPAFEETITTLCHADYAVAVNSATSALHLACLALNVGPGDTVWTTPNTFVASANCARYCGAEVDFVDIDPGTWCISVAALAHKLAMHDAAGKPLPKVLIPVHFAGQSCDMKAIAELGIRYGFRIIEDASHAIGSTYAGEPVGSCQYSDITVLSFHPVKIITTGEGGMALTNNAALAKHMSMMRSHGITRDTNDMNGPSQGPWYYEQLELGMNYRMTDIHAALGLSQSKKLVEFVEQRNQLVARYDAALRHLPIRRQSLPAETRSAHHLYVIRVDATHHATIFNALREQGIGVNLHYFPVHLQPYYRQLGFGEGHCPHAEAYYKEAISLPLFASMSLQQQDQVIGAVSAAIENIQTSLS